MSDEVSVSVPTRPPKDNSNAGASTAYVDASTAGAFIFATPSETQALLVQFKAVDPFDLGFVINPMYGRLNALESGAHTATIGAATWAILNANPGTFANEGAFVLTTDTGSHTDPVVGGVVPNQGVYVWSTSPVGWKRIGDFTPQPLTSPTWGAAGPIVIETGASNQLNTILCPNFVATNGSAILTSQSATTATRETLDSTCTITIASPAVITLNAHGFAVNTLVRFYTTGALPTGLSINTNYFVIAAGLTTNTFEVSTTQGGSAVNTSGTQSGVQSVSMRYEQPEYFFKTITSFDSGGPFTSALAINVSLINGTTDFFVTNNFVTATTSTTFDVTKPEILRAAIQSNGLNNYTSIFGLNIIGGVPGGSVPNQSPMGYIDLYRNARLGADTNIVPVVQADAVAAGMTLGAYSPTGPLPAGAMALLGFDLPTPAPAGYSGFLRIAMVPENLGIFPECNLVLWTRTLSESIPLVLERKVSSGFAYFIGWRREVLGTTGSGQDQEIIGMNVVQSGNGGRATFGLMQGNYGSRVPLWVMRDDFGGAIMPTAGTGTSALPDNPLYDDYIHLYTAQRKAFYDNQVLDNVSGIPTTEPTAFTTISWLTADATRGGFKKLYQDAYINAADIDGLVVGTPLTALISSRPKQSGHSLRKLKNTILKLGDPTTLTARFPSGLRIHQNGDSFTEATGNVPYTALVLGRISGNAALVTSIGPVVCQNNAGNLTGNGLGITGKRAGDFTATFLYNSVTGQGLKRIGTVDDPSITNFAQYLALDQPNRKLFTPYWRPTAAGDNPFFARNGGVVDFSFFQTGMTGDPSWGTGNPDVYVINLGTNDGPLFTEAGASIDILYRMARRQWPNCLILIVTNATPFSTFHALENSHKWNYETAPLIKTLMQYVRSYQNPQSANVIITIASPGVIADTAHGFTLNQPLKFSSTGALPTGITAGVTYYVKSTPDNNSYTISATPGGTVIATTGSQSGIQTRTTIADTKVFHIGMYQYVTQEGGDDVDVISTDAQTGVITGTITALRLIHKSDAVAQQYAEALAAVITVEA